jgi:hypothetical protein
MEALAKADILWKQLTSETIDAYVYRARIITYGQ